MFQMGLMDVIQAEREREIQSAIRRRQLLRPEDGPTVPPPAPARRTTNDRTMVARVRSTGG